MSAIRIFVVEDHNLVREGVVSLIKEFDGLFEIVGEARNGLDALSQLQGLETKPDIVLMDINLPILNGVETTAKLINLYPELKIVALTMVKQGGHIRRIMKKGAMGYVLKDCDKDELKMALLAVNRGETYFSPGVSGEIMSGLTRFKMSKRPIDSILTPRESEVLALIVQDFSNKQIADKLNISPKTVETHKQNLLGKTGANSMAGLVVYAIKHNLVDVF